MVYYDDYDYRAYTFSPLFYLSEKGGKKKGDNSFGGEIFKKKEKRIKKNKKPAKGSNVMACATASQKQPEQSNKGA